MKQDLRFQIVQGHHQPISVTRGDKVFLEQQIFMHNGAPFPVKVKLSFQNAHECLPVGFYTLSPASFRTNQYDSLELDRWNLEFIPEELPAKSS
jgi:hypothetical protein